jgi:predicted metal-dependent hydrolase
LKRPPTTTPALDAASLPTHQLSLPFRGTDAHLAGGAVRSRSERFVRQPAAARQARLPSPTGDTPADTADRVAAGLAIYLPPGKHLELCLTNNHYSMISVRRKADGYRLRLHRMFVEAEPRVMRALARYVVHNDRRASTLLGEYIERHQHIIKQQTRRPRNLSLRTAGRFHDLRVIFDRLNAERFGGALEARITWGPVASRRGRRRSIKMGSFAVEDRVIRIHPALDQACVPEYFVSWIVFHEMLHGKHEVHRENGRRRFHTAAFIEEEQRYPDYDRACAWEKQNLDRLLHL